MNRDWRELVLYLAFGAATYLVVRSLVIVWRMVTL